MVKREFTLRALLGFGIFFGNSNSVERSPRARETGRVGFRKFRGLGGISYLYGGFRRHTSMATRLILPRCRGPFTYDVCTRRGMGVYHNHPGVIKGGGGGGEKIGNAMYHYWFGSLTGWRESKDFQPKLSQLFNFSQRNRFLT